MSDIAIKAKNLTKLYKIGVRRGRHDSLREHIVHSVKSLLRSNGHSLPKSQHNDYIRAVNDVSFEIKHGEVVGFIGRNGAGKSTLLKILSQITEPTAGRVEIFGRVGSLLEVGTGFQGELSGRENIYLNGAILGMKKWEIDKKFDEIVAFSGVEKFIDTPVKRYSSGMYVRLAFAVAAHLEPEILIVDEVLAVGDAQFQTKCLNRMGEVAKQGRTVLFVSHNMASIQSLCSRAMVLQEGKLDFIGSPSKALEHYLSVNRSSQHRATEGRYNLSDRENRYLPGQTLIRGLTLLDGNGNPAEMFGTGQPLTLIIDMEGVNDLGSAQVGVIIKSDADQWLANFNSGMRPPPPHERSTHEQAILRVPKLPFVPGSYWIDVSIAQKNIGRLDYVERAATIRIIEHDVYGSGYTVSSQDGVIYLDGHWEIRRDTHRVALDVVRGTEAGSSWSRNG